MRSLTSRFVAGLAALGLAVLVSACGSEAADAGHSGHPTTDEPVITGEPAGYNAADVAFATNMVPHHKQAVDLAAMVPERSANNELGRLASEITATQVPEINILNVFLVQWNENPEIGSGENGGEHAAHAEHAMKGMVDQATMTRLESLEGPEFDRLWLESMISHHQGAVEMAKAEVADGKNVDAIAMAEMMITTQEAEIAQMQQMLEEIRP